MDKISWLHLSDFHFRAAGDNFSQDVSCDALARDIPSRLSDEFPLQFIVVTGDIAFSGQVSEYELALGFFTSLLDDLGLDADRLCVVPGNHDVDRSLQSYMYDGVRSRLTNQRDVDDFLGIEAERIQLMTRQSAFREFRERLSEDSQVSETAEGLARVRIYDLNGFRMCVLELNSAWLSGDKDRQGNLLVGERQLIGALSLAESHRPHLTVALAHHPMDWAFRIRPRGLLQPPEPAGRRHPQRSSSFPSSIHQTHARFSVPSLGSWFRPPDPPLPELVQLSGIRHCQRLM